MDKIQPMIKGNVCMNADTEGCLRNAEETINYIKSQPSFKGFKNVLVIGASQGYGFASRVANAFGGGASTLGVYMEREPKDNRTGGIGYYNIEKFNEMADKEGLKYVNINGNAFTDDIKNQVIDVIKNGFGPVDLVVYSLAAPKRQDPETGEMYRSALKVVGKPFEALSISMETGEPTLTTIEPATDEEIRGTIKVMGGEDWERWMSMLSKAGALTTDCQTVAYSYLGPAITERVYHSGTIGMAKADVERAAKAINSSVFNGKEQAHVVVCKAIVTRASAVIPMVPLYISLLYSIMKKKGTHEGPTEQMHRLYSKVMGSIAGSLDSEKRIRIDNFEMESSVQKEISDLWATLTIDNVTQKIDLRPFKEEFLKLHGF